MTSAPGKIIVAGEYAVLQGAPAICIAVNRRATVTIARGGSVHSVSAPGYRQEEQQFEHITEIAGEYPLLAAVWDQFSLQLPQPLRINIDTSNLCSDRQKLGIGSSAAAAVALSAAFAVISGQDAQASERAHAAHRTLQSGRGSGADVASSVHGGVIEYRMDELATTRLRWPADLHYALLWSGRSSSTTVQLQKLDSIGVSGTAALENAAESAATAWRDAAAKPILVAMRKYADALRQFDDLNQLGIFAAGHAALADSAAESGLVYKPCGAGGGDFGIAIASDLRSLDSFVATAKEEGFVHSELAIDPVGLVVEQGAQ